MIVTHYQNKTLCNRVFFGKIFTNLLMISHIHRIHVMFNDVYKVVQYETQYNAIPYSVVFKGGGGDCLIDNMSAWQPQDCGSFLKWHQYWLVPGSGLKSD